MTSAVRLLMHVFTIAALALATARSATAGSDETLETIPTRRGVTQSFLLVRPEGAAVASVVLFTGGAGRLDLVARASGPVSTNFLVRNRAGGSP